MDDQQIRNDLVEWLVRKKVTGAKHQLQTVVGYALPSHLEGRGKTLLEGMIADPDAPVQGYGGGHRANVQLVSLAAGTAYLREHDRDLPDWF